MATRRRVLIAARPFDLSDAQFDAFVTRNLENVEAISSQHDVALLGLRRPSDHAQVSRRLRDLPYSEVLLPAPRMSRFGRVVTALSGWALAPTRSWERAIDGHARMYSPHLVVSIGPWLDTEYRRLYARTPSVHFYEEDVTRMPEIASQSSQARRFRRIEAFVRGRSAARPSVVVYISEGEATAARARFPRSRHVLLPLTLTPSEWPVACSCSEGDRVLVAGNLAQARNAEGLAEVLAEVERRGIGEKLPFVLVSDAGLHDSLRRFIAFSWIEYRRPGGLLYKQYRQARIALVPGARATGLKTTVLQAWSTGCPVVAHAASAQTVGPDGQRALVAGSSASEIVDQLRLLFGDPDRRGWLAVAGFEQISHRFDHDAQRLKLLELAASESAIRRKGGAA